jgi:pyruvate,water dikinase
VTDPLTSPTRPTTWWTTTNLNEAIPGIATPLTWTFWYLPTERNIRRVFHRFGVLARSERVVPEEIDERFLGIFHGRAAANLNVFRRTVDRMPGTSGEKYEEQFFGALRSDLSGSPTRRRYALVVAKAPTVLWRLERRVREDRARTDRWWREAVLSGAVASPRALLAHAQRRFEHVIYGHGLVTSLDQAIYERLDRVCEQAGLPEHATVLLGGFGSVEESQMVRDLWAVAHGTSTIDAVIARHGFHGLDEGELLNSVWREDRPTLDALVQSYRDLPDPHVGEAARAEARRSAEQSVLAALPRTRRSGARLLLRLARRFIPLRETGKSSFLQALDVARCAARELGRLLQSSGTLDVADDVFLLTIGELLDPEVPHDVRSLVAERRELRREYGGLTLPNVWQGMPPRQAAPSPGKGPTDQSERPEVIGIGVQPGIVMGRVRVVQDPVGAADLAPSEILVCHATDPGWTSLFPIAAAVVIDVGGTMSHGAIVARELGVPCVVNTKDGTHVLGTGDLVRVDGLTGRVEILERA